jgi:hypothetical protein
MHNEIVLTYELKKWNITYEIKHKDQKQYISLKNKKEHYISEAGIKTVTLGVLLQSSCQFL